MLRVAVPNKGALSEAASDILAEAGYRRRRDSKDLSAIDIANDIEFYFLRPKDIPTYVGGGKLDLGITGRDLAADAAGEVDELLPLGFGASTFRYAAPRGESWTVERLAGARIATSYANVVEADLAARGIEAEVVRLDGAVEISIQLGVADCIADVVGSGRTLALHDLEPFGDVLCDSEGILVSRAGSDVTPEMATFRARLKGVVFAQQYMMLDYDCPRSILDTVVDITPGVESPTVSPLADPEWVAVRSMVPRKKVNRIMDELAAAGARAILASDIRLCRMGG